jgi:hypothetical protein
MPIRSAAGSGAGVTYASTSPATSSAGARPSATSMPLRARSASACPRVRSGPGAIHAQPIRSPTPAPTNTQVSSSRPCGRMYVKKVSPAPAPIITPPVNPMLSRLVASRYSTGTISTPDARHWAVSRALLVHTAAAKFCAWYSL